MKEEYFCIKCGKLHSIEYNVHKRYAFDLSKIEKIQKTINQIIDILENWNHYMKNKHWYWNEESTGLEKIEDDNNEHSV